MSIENYDYSLFLFDLDSTLTEPISGGKFPQTIDDRKLMPGRREKLQDLQAHNKLIAVVTNQGGAAWGIFDPNDMTRYLTKFVEDLDLGAVFVCYHDTSEKAKASPKTIANLVLPDYYKGWERRKPGPGMLIEAMDFFGVDRQDTLMIGDREEDKEAAENAGCSFVWAWDFFGDGPIIV